jgi:hypothetical protein
MKYIYTTAFFSFLLFYFYNNQSNKSTQFILAFVQNKYVNEPSENGTEKANISIDKDVSTTNFIGVFPKENDTITIYKLKVDLKEKPEKFSFWSKKNNKQSITFYCSEQDDVKVTFTTQNNIIVNNDIYTVNNEYYIFLKQKIFEEKSILDLAFFLKDGYGDYSQTLEPLNKNWRNQKENNIHKIIKAKIKNKNFQTDDQFFTYKINYKYNKNGVLHSISGENRFNKKFIRQNNKHIAYCIESLINERSTESQNSYKNKNTLFDSIIGNREVFSNSTTYHYKKYQSKLKIFNTDRKPKNIEEILKVLIINKKELE